MKMTEKMPNMSIVLSAEAALIICPIKTASQLQETQKVSILGQKVRQLRLSKVA